MWHFRGSRGGKLFLLPITYQRFKRITQIKIREIREILLNP
ncbi:hypothetical protein PL10110_630022 [Planktothrix agardhii]|nr:hypothetical protein PL10110_630022 [Planktothrix agardhii]